VKGCSNLFSLVGLNFSKMVSHLIFSFGNNERRCYNAKGRCEYASCVVCKRFRLYSQSSDSDSKDHIFRNLRGKALDKYKVGLKLTNHQRDLLAGCSLGDAGIALRPNGLTAWVKFEQTYEVDRGGSRREYVEHLYQVIKPFVGAPPKVYRRRYYHKEEDVYRRSKHFRTYSHECFLFYNNAFKTSWVDEKGKLRTKKIVPEDIHRWLNPRSLAYWLMDDGGKGGSSGYVLHTEGFTHSECKRLAKALGTVFGFVVSIQRDRQYYNLYIPAKSRDHFTEVVYPHIVPEMRWKLII
jgi:hypothetical protein